MPHLASIRRRTFLATAAASAALPSLAQTFPSKPMRVVVPAVAGSSADLLARLLGERDNARALRDKAFILETPIDNEGDDQRNVDALWSLIK